MRRGGHPVENAVQYALLNSGPYFVSLYGTANYLHTLMGGAQEYGAAPLNLRYDAMVTSLAQFGAGVLGGYSVPVSYGELTAWASLGGIGTLGYPHIGNTETIGSFSGREIALAAPVGAFTPAAGVALTGKGKWSTDAYWGGQFGSATSNESFGVQARYEW